MARYTPLFWIMSFSFLGCLGGKQAGKRHKLFLPDVQSAAVKSKDVYRQLDSMQKNQLMVSINSARSMGLVKVAIKKSVYVVTAKDTFHLRLWEDGFKWKGDFGYKVTRNKEFFRSLMD